MEYNMVYESIDEFGTYDMKGDLKRLINYCQGDSRKALEMKADEVIAYYDKQNFFGSLELSGKKNYDVDGKLVGEWRNNKLFFWYDEKQRQELRDYLPIRLSRFLCMFKEDELRKTLFTLGADVKEATPEEDMLFKVDLWVNGYAVSVFKDSEYGWRKAKEKLQKSRPVDCPRVYFAFDKYSNNPNDIKAVERWLNNIEKYKFVG